MLKSFFHLLSLSPLLLLLLLSRFSHVQLCVTPKTAAHQAPPSLGFSRQEHWSWVAISFSNAWKWKVKVKSLSRVRLLVTPWTVAYQAPPSMGFPRQGYWSGVPSPSPLFHPRQSIISIHSIYFATVNPSSCALSPILSLQPGTAFYQSFLLSSSLSINPFGITNMFKCFPSWEEFS